MEWSPPVEQALGDALDQAWISLNHIVEEQPPFEEVTGAPVNRLRVQAVEAIKSMEDFQSANGLGDKDAMSYLYILGFTVGTVYGARRRVSMKD